MAAFKPATRLEEVAAAVELTPLQSGDSRYVDIAAGRDTDELRHLRICLLDYGAEAGRFARITFTGHRGSGKSTELLRLEHDVRERFTVVHMTADDALLNDYDYTDLFLWIVDALIRQLQKQEIEVSGRLVDQVVDWFAEVTLEEVSSVRKEIEAGATAELRGKLGLFTISAALLARITSMVRGSLDRRTETRKKLQSYSSQLIDHVNRLLRETQHSLKKRGLPPHLLIVVDNLDRLPPETSQRLFFTNGDFLKRLDAHVIYTVPIACVLAPCNIGAVFENQFTLPMVKTRNRDGTEFRPGRAALKRLLAERLDLDAVFKRGVVHYLIDGCGGSVRDLMRLVNYAQRAARSAGQAKIDLPSAKDATRKMRLDFERLLIPAGVYYPLLARIHNTKRDFLADATPGDPTEVSRYQRFFSQLLFNGSVLEYNGGASWYDVHPVIQETDAFREAQQALANATTNDG
jgi:hypothetical protein